MTVYPDALIVYTHRDPVTCIASACSLSAEATRGPVDDVRRRHDRPHPARHAGQGGHAVRPSARRTTRTQFVDVDYQDFVSRPGRDDARDLRAVRAGRGRPSVDEAVTKLDAESRQGGRRPKHSYDLADYGLTEDEVRAAF